ncbi:lipoprotein-releasing ABC transporter permease subunit [Pseudomarimonas salicorniae]|uniref:Lipoprotein-releasing ABC transporter permease subunit n=1 Tax=Pseudomarimonas salicorniae TaxID=2933270 RepID=A0ABT0GEH9_9GAMM|nr:lipoprotein-releasing ABC transporter permease subunit [Lysobacter sp. CAU 1642]MCK7592956.1 lipoprotein-releasing ABC transporter permease subunit [Lysobacter sp. CAU 1642]
MFHPLPLALGLRYTRAKRRNHFISFISAVSMLGIALGVTVLITVISVMNGFEQELRTRILGMVAHATISGAGTPITDWPAAVDLARSDPRVLGAAPYVEGEAMLQGASVQGAVLRGVLPEREAQVSEVAEKMKRGSLDELEGGAFNIVLGSELAMWLGVELGDKVTVYVPEFRSTPIGSLPQVRRFTVVGIFEVGAQQYDLGMALIHMDDAQRLLRLGQGVSGIRLRLVDMFTAWQVARDLGDRFSAELGDYYRVRDWSREHSNFFRAIRTEKMVMFIILSLIVAVAAFNLVSSLVMLVTDKQADIAILRTLGLTPRQVMSTFIVQGSLIGFIGIVSGLVGGVLLTLNLQKVVHVLERTFGFEALPSDVYYISGGIPTLLQREDVAAIAVVAFVLCTLATIYPAWRASRVDPAAALRYE